MGTQWPDGGPWIVVPAGASVDLDAAVTALAAAASVRVAAVAIGSGPRPDDGVATWVSLRDRPALAETTGIVTTLAATHGLVLVVGEPGLLVSAGQGGWTMADLARSLGAPVVVATDDGEHAANNTTLALGVLDARGLAGAVVVVTGTTATDAELAELLPVRPAGRVPAGAPHDPETARGFLDPMLHASSGAPPAPSAPTPRPPTSSGTRVVMLLVGVFVTMSLVAVGLACCSGPGREETVTQKTPLAWTPQTPAAQYPARTSVPVEQVCPTRRLVGEPVRPDPATTARVDDAWQRIETWLAVKAPDSHAALRPGAAPAALDAAQRHMSVQFPPDLVASLLRHDGAESGFTLPFMHQPMPTARIPDAWASLCGIVARAYLPGEDDWWNAGYIPFADAGDGGYLLADRRPGHIGQVAEFYNEDGVRFSGWPDSVAALLEQTATSLETGEPVAGRYRPVLTGDRVGWDII